MESSIWTREMLRSCSMDALHTLLHGNSSNKIIPLASLGCNLQWHILPDCLSIHCSQTTECIENSLKIPQIQGEHNTLNRYVKTWGMDSSRRINSEISIHFKTEDAVCKRASMQTCFAVIAHHQFLSVLLVLSAERRHRTALNFIHEALSGIECARCNLVIQLTVKKYQPSKNCKELNEGICEKDIPHTTHSSKERRTSHINYQWKKFYSPVRAFMVVEQQLGSPSERKYVLVLEPYPARYVQEGAA